MKAVIVTSYLDDGSEVREGPFPARELTDPVLQRPLFLVHDPNNQVLCFIGAVDSEPEGLWWCPQTQDWMKIEDAGFMIMDTVKGIH